VSVHIAIVEDQMLVRRGLVSLVDAMSRTTGSSSGFRVVADVGSPKELISVLESIKIDVILLEYSLNVGKSDEKPLHAMDGHTLIKWIRSHYPETRIITVSSHSSMAIIHMAISAGSMGYISKGASETALEHAIQSVMNGDAYVERRFLKNILHEPFSTHVAISAREAEVLRLINNGLRPTEIARKMNLSFKTVSAHKLRAMSKLGARSDIELYRLTTEMAL
jgi:two-component system capsular synthesis response regulator RcsB